MKLFLRWSVAVCAFLCYRAVFRPPATSSPAEVRPSVDTGPSAITNEATSGEWASWIPPRTDPAVVMQVVSEGYVDLEKNFLRLMELNSAFTCQHLFLICLDDAPVPIVASLGIHCIPVGTLEFHSHTDMWKTRVRVVSCLVMEGYDVISI